MEFCLNGVYDTKGTKSRMTHGLGEGKVSKKNNYLVTPANVNGTTASPCRAKIQRIGLLNITCILKIWKQVNLCNQ